VRVFDASSIIYGWDNYPIDQFPPLWKWLGEQVKLQQLAICNVALGEVDHKTPELGKWLRDHDIAVLPAGEAELLEALRIRALIGIMNDQYHPKGVDENDIISISVCRIHGLTLISDEERQPNPPQVLTKMKIPAVCKMNTVNVECVNFLDFLKQSGQVFG
jgi:hypothetical protein